MSPIRIYKSVEYHSGYFLFKDVAIDLSDVCRLEQYLMPNEAKKVCKAYFYSSDAVILCHEIEQVAGDWSDWKSRQNGFLEIMPN